MFHINSWMNYLRITETIYSRFNYDSDDVMIVIFITIFAAIKFSRYDTIAFTQFMKTLLLTNEKNRLGTRFFLSEDDILMDGMLLLVSNKFNQ